MTDDERACESGFPWRQVTRAGTEVFLVHHDGARLQLGVRSPPYYRPSAMEGYRSLSAVRPGVSVGLDLVDVGEVAESIARFGDRYLHRVYTEAEIAYARAAPAETARRLGARFAAKEAALKTFRARDRGIGWRSIEVVFGTSGAPEIVLSGEALAAARAAGIARLSLSLTHQGALAAAVVIGEHVRAPRRRLLCRRHSAS
jgi:holo-[acyl-carrier protein] synthase